MPFKPPKNNELFSVIQQHSATTYPLGFYLLRVMTRAKKKEKNLALFAISDFYQTDQFLVGKKNKPIAFILKEDCTHEKK